MKITSIFKRTYYAIMFHKRTDKLIYEHDEAVDFKIYKTNWKTWYADPMVFKYEGKEWLFVEKMDMIRRMGTIAVAKINANGIGVFKEVLRESFHLSYPMVFLKDGNIYMIPESAKEKAIYLYKCVEFPYQWTRYKTLLKDNYYADTSVFFCNNHWYLITCEMDPEIGSRTKIHIYNADSIEEGYLRSLSFNNSFDYSYSSRGAGNIINKEDSLFIRPTQVGDLKSYGKNINFYKITLGKNYSEQLINIFGCERICLPNNLQLTGTHTYSLSDDYEIIDIQYTRLSHPLIVFLTIVRKVKAFIKK